MILTPRPQSPVPWLCPVIVLLRLCAPAGGLAGREGRKKRRTKGEQSRALLIRTLGLGYREIIPGVGVALHFGEDSLPSSAIVSSAGKGYRAVYPLGWQRGRGERRIWGPGMGTRRKWGAWQSAEPAEQVGANARLSVRSLHVVGVRRFHSNFGESRVWRRRRCDQSESPEGNKLCKSPSGDGSHDSGSLKILPLREFAV